MQFSNPTPARSSAETGRGLHTASADPEQTCLTADAELMVATDHRLALGNRPALSSALS